MCKDALPNEMYYRHEQPGVWTKTNGTKITKVGIQQSKRGYDWNFKKIIHAWLLWSRDFVPCLSCMNLLELEGTLSNYVRRPYAHFNFFFFTNTSTSSSSSNRVRNNWNGLPSNIVLAGTLNSFKNLDKHWKPGEPVWPAGKHWDLGSNPLRLSFLFKNCGLWTLSCDFVPCN